MTVEELIKSGGPEAFGRNLRAIRAFRGLEQRELAKLSGVDQASISMLENDRRRPRRSTVEKLAAALGVEVETLDW